MCCGGCCCCCGDCCCCVNCGFAGANSPGTPGGEDIGNEFEVALLNEGFVEDIHLPKLPLLKLLLALLLLPGVEVEVEVVGVLLSTMACERPLHV